MGTDNLFWKRKPESRPIGRRGKPKDTFLIICEGEKTEPNYFKSFRVKSAQIKVWGEGANTLSLVKRTKEIVEDYIKEGVTYDQVWCVFDRDSFSKANFNDAFSFAQRNKIRVAYSNEAFELWYLLHYDYLNTGVSRKQYIKKLTDRLGFKYKKNSKSIYQYLLEKQPTAIKNAKKLLESYLVKKPVENNPSTNVHLLVEELNKYL